MTARKRAGGKTPVEIEAGGAGRSVSEQAPPAMPAAPLRPSGGSRTAQRRDERAKRRRRTGLILLLLLLAACAAAAAWRWDDVSGLWRGDGGDRGGDPGLYTVNPLTGQPFQDSAVNTLVCLTADNQARLLLYVSRNRDGAVEYFPVPEDIVGKSQDGSDLRLASALAANPERTVELRYMVESLTGQPVHYVAVIPLKALLLLAERTGFPAVRVSRDTEVYNPFTGAQEKLAAGQELKDTDRILSYLLAEGDLDEYGARCERAASYLPALMEVIGDLTQEEVAGALLGVDGAFLLAPAASSREESARYLASLAAAWADAGETAFFRAPEIEVLNGCGVVGAGTGMKSLLESRGFRVSEAGKNAKVTEGGQEYNDFSHQYSVIRYASADPLAEAYARYLAMLFRIPRVERYPEGRGITVIVGSDLAVPAPEP